MARSHGRNYHKNSHKKGGNSTGNFSRAKSANLYQYGAAATKLDERKDEVSLKYYSKIQKIESRAAVTTSAGKIVCVLLVLTCAILIVFARSVVYNYQFENSRMSKQYEAEKEKTETVLARQTEKLDLEYIESVAVNKLNMTRPQSYQIVYIDVPKSDYTIVHGASLAVKKQSDVKKAYENIMQNIACIKDLFMVQ